METVKLGDVVCTLKRSKRRTVSIYPHADGTAEIRAPFGIGADEIVRLMGKYAPKVAEQCIKLRKTEEKRQGFSLDYGDGIRLFGTLHKICGADSSAITYDDEKVYIPKGLSSDGVLQAVVSLYKQTAKEYFTRRVAEISPACGFYPSAVKINSARTHWASCSRKNTLNFSWYCLMAEPAAIDYIIIHELCHLRHFNHSPEFWREVEAYCPEYKKYRAYFRLLGREIGAEKWEQK